MIESLGTIPCDAALGAGLLKKTLHLSETYATYKSNPKPDLIPYMLQDYVDFISSVVKLKDIKDRMAIGFLLNTIVKNGFFNFVLSGDNTRVKVLRNMRAHDNVIVDKQTWNANIQRIASVINDLYTLEEVRQLEEDVCQYKKIILYDQNDKDTVSFMIIEEPGEFLRKLITLCHIQIFALGLNKNLVLSRRVFQNYWMKKYPEIDRTWMKEMQLQEHCEKFKTLIESHTQTESMVPVRGHRRIRK